MIGLPGCQASFCIDMKSSREANLPFSLGTARMSPANKRLQALVSWPCRHHGDVLAVKRTCKVFRSRFPHRFIGTSMLGLKPHCWPWQKGTKAMLEMRLSSRASTAKSLGASLRHELNCASLQYKSFFVKLTPVSCPWCEARRHAPVNERNTAKLEAGARGREGGQPNPYTILG